MGLRQAILQHINAFRYRGNKPAKGIRNADPVWLDPSHWERLLCFVHVPKAAGTSFKNVLWRVYGRSFWGYHKRLSDYTPESVTPAQAKNILALGGHFPYGFHSAFGQELGPDGVFAGREVLYVSVVRNPVDRLLSYFRFVRSFPAHRLHDETKHMDCETFFNHMIEIGNRECTGSLQAAMVAGQGVHPREAVDLVDEKFLAVAPVENVGEMISALSSALDWPAVEAAHKNQAPAETISEKERAFVAGIAEQYCQHDLKLYRYVADSPRGFVGRLSAS